MISEKTARIDLSVAASLAMAGLLGFVPALSAEEEELISLRRCAERPLPWWPAGLARHGTHPLSCWPIFFFFLSFYF